MAPRGRPTGPTDDTREQVMQAAFRLLASEGPAAVTPVRLHRETGVARTTVYRHWPTPDHVLRDILTQAIARHELGDLTGDLDHDLRRAVRTLTDRFENRPVRTFFRATLETEPESPNARPVDQQYIEGLVAPVRDVLQGAIDRGEITGDAEALTSRLCGPLLLDHLLLDRAVDRASVERRTTDFLEMVRPGD
ncbi:MAG: TetR/AcrR family transcriptional regulator [Actinomycetota bacterium]